MKNNTPNERTPLLHAGEKTEYSPVSLNQAPSAEPSPETNRFDDNLLRITPPAIATYLGLSDRANLALTDKANAQTVKVTKEAADLIDYEHLKNYYDQLKTLGLSENTLTTLRQLRKEGLALDLSLLIEKLTLLKRFNFLHELYPHSDQIVSLIEVLQPSQLNAVDLLYLIGRSRRIPNRLQTSVLLPKHRILMALSDENNCFKDKEIPDDEIILLLESSLFAGNKTNFDYLTHQFPHPSLRERTGLFAKLSLDVMLRLIAPLLIGLLTTVITLLLVATDFFIPLHTAALIIALLIPAITLISSFFLPKS
ncbi:MAG TPA: hypothetical protein VD770_02200, partial [Coxiellaceae bacterium]|nr:hypothetical protein [Coxiellaceae bacterium]